MLYNYTDAFHAVIELFRLLPCMDFHLLLQGGSYSFCTKLQCPILLNGSGLKQIVCQAPSAIIFLPKKAD